MIEQLVEEIHIIGAGRIRPIYCIPRHSGDTEPATDDGTTVRTMGNLVGDTGIEPVASSVSRKRSPTELIAPTLR